MKNFLISIIYFAVCLVSYAQTEIQMEKEGGVYKVPCIINGLKLKFIFDTGASNICISENIANMMLENGYLNAEDIKGSSSAQVADGRIVNNTKIILKNVQIGTSKLSNVEAVVIHNQTAPLLFGQSALSKLGKYSIYGDKLIIGTKEVNRPTNTYYDPDNFSDIINEAYNYYINGAYEDAAEKYKILYDNDEINALGKLEYANSLFFAGNKEDAIEVYLEIEDEINSDFPDKKEEFYYYLGKGLWCTKDYTNAIPYLKKAHHYAKIWSEDQKSISSMISSIYRDQGNKSLACVYTDNIITEYIIFMGIKATDCWNKKYTDQYLADLYYHRFLSSDITEFDKFAIIAAAWGNKDAIETCKKFELDYSKKPYKYEY